MAPTQGDLASVKDLLAQITQQVEQMERNIRNGQPTPAQQLRMILMGPPGAGMYHSVSLRILVPPSPRLPRRSLAQPQFV